MLSGLVLQILDQFLFHVVENEVNLLMLRRTMNFFQFLPNRLKETFQELQVGYELQLDFRPTDRQF